MFANDFLVYFWVFVELNQDFSLLIKHRKVLLSLAIADSEIIFICEDIPELGSVFC